MGLEVMFTTTGRQGHANTSFLLSSLAQSLEADRRMTNFDTLAI